MSLVATQKLSCHFGGIKAVDLVDFKLDSGEVRAIIGPNGAGKSTFVSMLCGRLRPTAGTIHFNGADITRTKAHERTAMGIAYTFQITSIFKELTCLDNVELAVQSSLMRKQGARQTRTPLTQKRRLTQKSLSQAALVALAKVGLESSADAKAQSLSYGHQRLLEIAMGLGLEPKLLMLDEPTQGLANSEIEDFILLMRRVAKSATILLIEHNMDVVMGLAEKITVFNEGRILAEGTPDQIQNNLDVQKAYLGS